MQHQVKGAFVSLQEFDGPRALPNRVSSIVHGTEFENRAVLKQNLGNGEPAGERVDVRFRGNSKAEFSVVIEYDIHVRNVDVDFGEAGDISAVHV